MKNPIMFDFPDSFETERLLIRVPQDSDAEAVRTAVLDSHAELKPWMPWAVTVSTLAEYQVRIREAQVEFKARRDMWLLLFEKKSQTLVGCSGLHRMNWSVPSFEIGYWVRTSYGRRGYITEAVAGITDFAFNTLGAQRVEIRCDELNERSAAVAQRLDFTHEGTLHHHSRHHLTDELRNMMIFARISP